MIFIDTNIVIYLAQGRIDPETFFDDEQVYGVSVISYIEIMSFLKSEECEFMQKFFSLVEIIDVDTRVAIECVNLRKKYQIKLADAIIAATALVYDGTLISADKGFRKVKELNFKEL